jgi:glucokinase
MWMLRLTTILSSMLQLSCSALRIIDLMLRPLSAYSIAEYSIQYNNLTCKMLIVGPVKSNKVRFTNRDSWIIDGDEIAVSFSIRTVSLINDFLAMGYGILTLDEDKECVALQKGERHSDAPIACIGAGTGLGECFLTPDSAGVYKCFPSEGGHAEFAPRDDVSALLPVQVLC